jgi:biopolymer transport protein ExbD
MAKRTMPGEAQADGSDMTPMIDIVFQLLIFFMLTMQFQEVEGKLLSQLPKVGTQSTPAPPREELRIVLCADGNTAEHLTNRGLHDQTRKDGAVCRLYVERHAVGEAAPTEGAPGRGTSNKAVYAAAGAKARELLDALGNANVSVVLDADPEVPYEHVLGVVDACKAVRINAVEFVANARLAGRLR